MRRLVCAAALFAVLFVAAPAGAQVRDPFDPLLTTESKTDTTAPSGETGTTPVVTPPESDPIENPPPPTDGLPNTGSDPKNLLALAYVLLAAGTVMVAISHLGELRTRRVV